ncbi:hypothetical protein G6F16_009802 [Rhizopus arrhizus]|nr:hypothetical protein G6F22_011062 [Rhizopus arrhizus]KAG0782280.1 hypothetical protein G6F21_011200 [Rhizopus arrhizus]KAG0804791.1 hypothetical protein G6F20_012420 [Rhizopus arrhizus]KAG0820407.1 hypothetical protein G6F19_012484 [Rhizopus arrhizus]KAG0820778.1 hypothetical protein G6F18_012475 [Rhizopus arrhizus]
MSYDESDGDYSDIPSIHSKEEEEEDYKKGGYHPVQLGDRFDNNRYIICRKLGWGHFSTVWLALDTLTECHVALKIVKSAQRYTDSALEEIKLLESVKLTHPACPGYRHITQLFSYFWHQGPYGQHVCMTFEVLGESLLSLMKRYDSKGIPQPIVKRIARQVLQGLDYLHRECKIIHTDLKPENVLVWIPDIEDYLRKKTKDVMRGKGRRGSLLEKVDTTGMSRNRKKRLKKKLKKQQKRQTMCSETIELEGVKERMEGLEVNYKVMRSSVLDLVGIVSEKDKERDGLGEIVVKIADLGNACWMEGEYRHIIQTRQYRSPEVIVGARWTQEADMWSASCMFFELLTGEFLFDPKAGSDYNKDDDHLAQILELLRTVPKILINSGQFSHDFFDRSGKLKHIKNPRYRRLRDVLHDTFLMSPEDADRISAFLLPMLEMDMTRRASASQMIQNEWLKEVSM